MRKIVRMKQEFIDLLPKIDLCLLALQGSRMLGLVRNTDADYDYRGVYVAKNDQLLSLNQKPKEQYEYCDSHDHQMDYVIYEVEKFIRLSLKGNPSIIHIFFVPKWNYKNDIGSFLVENRNVFLGEVPIRNAFAGYAMAQVLYLKRNHKFPARQKKEKHIRHCFRLFDTGQELLETGKITLPLKDPQKYLDLEKYVDDDERIFELFEKRDKEFNEVKSILPKQPDEYMANKILLKIRNWE